MDYVVMFEDNDERADRRGKFMREHLAFLKSKPDQISAAGPLKDAKSGLPAGGLWLVSAESREHVVALVMADPFWPTGLRKSFRILEWTMLHGNQSFDRSSGSDGPSQTT